MRRMTEDVTTEGRERYEYVRGKMIVRSVGVHWSTLCPMCVSVVCVVASNTKTEI